MKWPRLLSTKISIKKVVNMKYIFILLSVFLTGCVSVKYTTQEESVSYIRLGNQKIENLSFTKNGNKLSVTVQSSETKELDAVKDAVGLAVKGTAKKSSWACPVAELVKINLEKHLTDSK